MIQKQDNRYKWEVRDRLLAFLYTPFEKIQQARLKDIIERNCIAMQVAHAKDPGGVPLAAFHRSFAFNGHFYNLEGSAGPPVRNRLHPNLEPEIREYQQAEFDVTQFEKTVVSGYLTAVLSSGDWPGDWKALLPDMVGDELQRIVSVGDMGYWIPRLTQEKIDEFIGRRRPGYDAVRTRLAINLLL